MIKVIYVKYRVYYMDNDRQKIIIGTGLSYQSAVKMSQEWYSRGLSCVYEPEEG